MTIIEQLKNKFADRIRIFEKTKKRVFIDSKREDVRGLISFLKNDHGARFSTASGLDTRLGIEILYHMSLDKLGIVVSIRAMAEKPDMKIQTISDIFDGANWVEREIHEMLGVNFIGHPTLEKFLLPDDWPQGSYPYRKTTFDSENEGAENR